jgi:hypothetical protein
MTSGAVAKAGARVVLHSSKVGLSLGAKRMKQFNWKRNDERVRYVAGPRNYFPCFPVTRCCRERPYCTFNETVADGAATPLDAVTITV